MGKRADEPMNKTDKTVTIQADIERTRGDMSRTVNEIEERLSPAHIKEQIADVKQAAVGQYHDAKDHVKEDLSRELTEAKIRMQEELRHAKRAMQMQVHDVKRAVHDATVGKVQHMAHDARTGIVDTIRENPIPSAMIALGLGWLMMSGKSDTRRNDVNVRSMRSRYDNFDNSYDDYLFGGAEFDEYSLGYEGRDYDRNEGGRVRRVAQSARDGVADVGARVRGGVSDVTDRVRGGVHDATDRVRDGAGRLVDQAQRVGHDVSDTASDLAHRAGDRVEHLARDARMTGRRVVRRAGHEFERAEAGFERTMRENPLALGAVALAVGAAVGLSLPHTAKEDELMGQAKDRLFDRAEDVAHGVLETATEKVEELGGKMGSDNTQKSSGLSGSQRV